MGGTRIGVDVAVDVRAALGEAPIWDPDRGELVWVEIDAGCVHVTDVDSRADVAFDLGGTVGAAAPCSSGDLLVARDHDVVFVGRDGALTDFVDLPGTGTWRLNDGKCDPSGRFWVGGVVFDPPGTPSSLFRVDPDGSVQVMIPEVGVSNGLGWSPDGRTMYYVDTRLRTIDAFAFDPDDGTLGARRTVVEIPRERGVPDGITVDAEGAIWLARYRGGGVDRYTPDGVLDLELPLPVRDVTACAFGGADLATLYITTDGGRDEAPHAGAVFACRPGVTGLPGSPFRGSPPGDATATVPMRAQTLPG